MNATRQKSLFLTHFMMGKFLKTRIVLNLQSRDWGYSGDLLGFNSELAKWG